MKYGIALLFLVSTVNNIYCQTDPNSLEKQMYQTTLSQTVKTMVINTAGVSPNIAASFVNELSAWKEKVLSVQYDQSSDKLTLIHNRLLDPRELEDVLNKYQFKKNQIISHK